MVGGRHHRGQRREVRGEARGVTAVHGRVRGSYAVIALVGAWYNNPEAFQPIGLSTVPLSVEYILSAVGTGSRIR